MTRRELIKNGLGIAGILASGEAPATIVRSMIAASATSFIDDYIPETFEVEWISMQSPDQYVDTGFLPTPNMEVEFKVGLSGSGWKTGGVFGVFGEGVANFACARDNDGYIKFNLGNNTKTLVARTPFTVRMSAPTGLCEVNGKTWTTDPLSEMATSAMCIGSNRYSYKNPWNGTQTWFYCKIWENGELVRDFVPVRFTNSHGDSEGAIYDRLTRRLCRNKGGGSFVIGPDKIGELS